ncbi:uncharacterized protein LOC112558862 isoform X3 [Pomacea canaliculata]|nr:uncharacterized protein LOC112558862 isoform X3 [Pomacea canaliculata]
MGSKKQKSSSDCTNCMMRCLRLTNPHIFAALLTAAYVSSLIVWLLHHSYLSLVIKRLPDAIVATTTISTISVPKPETFPDPICVRAINESVRKLPEEAGKQTVLKIIVLTYRRPESLERCLKSLNDGVYNDTKVRLDIFIDRDVNGLVDPETLLVAHRFVFDHGPTQVHVHPHHVGLYGQWLRTWCLPVDLTSEIAVFLEDDVTVSPFFARWLRLVHAKYDSYLAINGYALQSESVKHAEEVNGSKMLQGPPGEAVFLYPVLGSWGFSPKGEAWADFIRWYAKASKDNDFVPFVPGLKSSRGYLKQRKMGKASSMWTMWHIYHSYQNGLLTLYASFPGQQGLSHNWKEPGLHYNGISSTLKPPNLLTVWPDNLHLPNDPIVLNAKGEVMGRLNLSHSVTKRTPYRSQR